MALPRLIRPVLRVTASRAHHSDPLGAPRRRPRPGGGPRPGIGRGWPWSPARCTTLSSSRTFPGQRSASRSARKVPCSTAASRARWVAAITRTSTRVLRVARTARPSPVWRNRSSIVGALGASSPISSRKTVRPSTPGAGRRRPRAPSTRPDQIEASGASCNSTRRRDERGVRAMLTVEAGSPRSRGRGLPAADRMRPGADAHDRPSPGHNHGSRTRP